VSRRWRLGLVGCGWISEVYVDALVELPNGEAVACCATSLERAQAFAARKGVPHACGDWRELVAREDVDVVTVGVPNALHHVVTIAALEAGKHVIVEKPLCLSLEEAREIVATAERVGKVVAYAENLCFAPKYVRAKQLLDQGALGQVRVVKQVEKHDGPHTRWFYERDAAGGGALLDMGCHSIEFARWLLGKPAVTAVWAHMDTWKHADTELEDHVVLHLEFAGGATALLESGWSLLGGMASNAELQGTAGVLRVDLLQDGAGMSLYQAEGEEPGWRSVDADWHRQQGYPQELAHFLACMESGEQPRESAADGLAVLEIILAAYESARTGAKVTLPFQPQGVTRPVDLWKAPAHG
jgi:predicted dehydrogenase